MGRFFLSNKLCFDHVNRLRVIAEDSYLSESKKRRERQKKSQSGNKTSTLKFLIKTNYPMPLKNSSALIFVVSTHKAAKCALWILVRHPVSPAERNISILIDSLWDSLHILELSRRYKRKLFVTLKCIFYKRRTFCFKMTCIRCKINLKNYIFEL